MTVKFNEDTGEVILSEAGYSELVMAENRLLELQVMIRTISLLLGDVYISASRAKGREEFNDGIRMLIRALHSAVKDGDIYPLQSLTDEQDAIDMSRNIVVCCGQCRKVFSGKQSVGEDGKWSYVCPKCGKEIKP